MRKKAGINYFTDTEKAIWALSAVFIVAAFIAFDRENYMTLAASLIGITSLIYNAKGHPFGQFLMIIFGVIYGVISFKYAYYGEMITYMGMTVPMAIFSLISWLKNPYEKGSAQVRVNTISSREFGALLAGSAGVTMIFYFVLAAFDTENLALSTVSITTSFLAAYLTFRRSAYFAAAYAANDCVLIFMWLLAAREDAAYISVMVCFIAFLASDIYGYVNWRKMRAAQRSSASARG